MEPTGNTTNPNTDLASRNTGGSLARLSGTTAGTAGFFSLCFALAGKLAGWSWPYTCSWIDALLFWAGSLALLPALVALKPRPPNGRALRAPLESDTNPLPEADEAFGDEPSETGVFLPQSPCEDLVPQKPSRNFGPPLCVIGLTLYACTLVLYAVRAPLAAFF